MLYRRLWQKLLLTVVLLLIFALAYFKPLDNAGTSYVDQALSRSLLSFAIARGLNGVISVAQGTEIAIQPAGVGLNFTPGQVLDPINDLVERFSLVMLLSSSSLGVQKVLLVMSGWDGILIGLGVFLALFIGVLWWKNPLPEGFSNIVKRLLMLLLILRFAMPIVSVANERVYQLFLQPQYQQASENLEQAQQQIGKVNQQLSPVGPADQDLLAKAKALYESALQQVDFDKKLDQYSKAAETVSENVIQLIVVFTLQTVLFPLAFKWGLMRLLSGAFRRN